MRSLEAAPRAETPWLSAATDVILARIQLLDPIHVLFALGVVLLTSELRRRVRDRRQRGSTDSADAAFAMPDFLRHLFERLAHRGLRRPRAETLEAFASRVRASPSSDAPLLADLLEDCAAWRYGGIGDPPKLAERALTHRLR